MKALTPRALTLVAALSLAGCASAPSGDPFGGGESRPARIEVVNTNFADATIWAVYPGERARLGTVTGKTSSNFTLPSRTASEPVYLEIDLVGGERCITDTLTVDAGDVLRLEIPLQLSSMARCR